MDGDPLRLDMHRSPYLDFERRMGGLVARPPESDAFDAFREHVLQPLVGTAREEGNSVKFLLTDSWGNGARQLDEPFFPKSSGNSGATIFGPTCR